jgi:hypothetical protein
MPAPVRWACNEARRLRRPPARARRRRPAALRLPALGSPLVTLYALTNPQHTPWRVAARVLSHDVPCRWCLSSRCPQQHHGCLRAVREEAVVAAALELLADEPAPSVTRGTVR